MLGDMLGYLMVLFAGFPVILIVYLVRRGDFIRAYFKVEPSGQPTEVVNRVVVPEDEEEAKAGYEEAMPEQIAEVEKEEEVEANYVEAMPEQEEHQAEDIPEQVIEVVEEEVVPMKNAAPEIRLVPEQQTDEQQRVAGEQPEKKKKGKIPLIVKIGLIAIPFYFAYTGFKEAADAQRELDRLEAETAKDSVVTTTYAAEPVPANIEPVDTMGAKENVITENVGVNNIDADEKAEPQQYVDKNDKGDSEPKKQVAEAAGKPDNKQNNKKQYQFDFSTELKSKKAESSNKTVKIISSSAYIYEMGPDAVINRTTNYYERGTKVEYRNPIGLYLRIYYNDASGKRKEGMLLKADTDFENR